MDGGRPFAGEGLSLYVTEGTSIRYRRLRLGPRGGSCLRQGWSGRNRRTLRVAAFSASSGSQVLLTWPIPADLAGRTVSIDVRHYRNDVESLVSDPVLLTLDPQRAEVPTIRGAVSWLAPEVRAGGVVLLRWVWHPAPHGVQPEQFRIVFTAGPTNPGDLILPVEGAGDYEIETPPLEDAAPYHVELRGEAGTVIQLLAEDDLQADATGPPAPALVRTQAR